MRACITESACEYHTHQRLRPPVILGLIGRRRTHFSRKAMAGFREQDHFIFYSKAAAGKICEQDDCRFRDTKSHFHCKHCNFVRGGGFYDKLLKHIKSKHPEKLGVEAEQLVPKSGNGQKRSSSNETSTRPIGQAAASHHTLGPSDPAPEINPQFSPIRSFIVKKSKVSTPLSENPGCVSFALPPVSPLFHKTVSHEDLPPESNFDNVDPGSPQNQKIVYCAIPDCFEIENLTPLMRQRGRGGSGPRVAGKDWESTLRLITYHRLREIGDPNDKYICEDHWRAWYDFNRKLNISIAGHINKVPKKMLFDDHLSVSFSSLSLEQQAHHELTDLFASEKISTLVLDYLNLFEIRILSETCSAMRETVKLYLQNESVWKRLLSLHFFVDRPLDGNNFATSFAEISDYCLKMRKHCSITDLDFDSTVEDLIRLHSNVMQHETSISNLLQSFGYHRKPQTLDVLVFFVAKCLRSAMQRYSDSQKNCQIEGLSMSDFRVGVEASYIPFSLLLFDMVLTGNEGIAPSLVKNRSQLFKYIAINSIRQKICDVKVVTPFHMATSNDVSLSCSKSFMTLLNKAGISYSYAKDIKDGQKSRQLWNEFGITTTLQSSSSNMHWIECDNLETMLKSTTIHNAERLTHFITSQLEYIDNQYSVLDLYKKPPVHEINPSVFTVNEDDKSVIHNFMSMCLKKCVELYNHLQCDDVVLALSQGSSSDNREIMSIEKNSSEMPSVRLLSSENVLPKAKTVYLRMEKLCSSNIYDVKKLLDITAKDYGLSELSYVPSFAISPLLYASNALNKALADANLDRNSLVPLPYSVVWGIFKSTESIDISACNDSRKLRNVLLNAIEGLKDKPNAIFSVAILVDRTLKEAANGALVLSAVNKAMLQIFLAELLRKQGKLKEALDLMLTAHRDLSCLSEAEIETTLFPVMAQNKDYILECLVINSAVCCIQLGLFEQCLDILAKHVTNFHHEYHLALSISLQGCALASSGDYYSALEATVKACDALVEHLPTNHTVKGMICNQFGVIMAVNNNHEPAIRLLEKALEIFKETCGESSYQYLFANFNKILIKIVFSGNVEDKSLESACEAITNFYPEGYHLLESVRYHHLQVKLQSILTDKNNAIATKFLWDACFVLLLDRPFSWIDYPPSKHAVIFGADYQVWAHLDNLLHTNPLRYSWVSSIFLGSFHKLGNIHDKLLKRYGKFHLEKHAVSFLDDPTTSKVQYLLSMKDFVSSNEFYYHDILAGLTELFLAFLAFANEIQEGSFPEGTTLNCIDLSGVKEFCETMSKFHPALKLVSDYLFTEGMSVLGLLEAQKFGDFDLDMAFTKVITPLQFTTRGINYGPALTYHIRDMKQLRPFEEIAIRSLWVSNKSDEPGHCRPQDQNLEALFNNSAKNCFKLGTVQNVLNKASMIQEREKCHRNLKIELTSDDNSKPTMHRFRPNSFIRLRAAWHKGLLALFQELKANKQENIDNSPLYPLHCKEVSLNKELLTVRELGEERRDKFIRA